MEKDIITTIKIYFYEILKSLIILQYYIIFDILFNIFMYFVKRGSIMKKSFVYFYSPSMII